MRLLHFLSQCICPRVLDAFLLNLGELCKRLKPARSHDPMFSQVPVLHPWHWSHSVKPHSHFKVQCHIQITKNMKSDRNCLQTVQHLNIWKENKTLQFLYDTGPSQDWHELLRAPKLLSFSWMLSLAMDNKGTEGLIFGQSTSVPPPPPTQKKTSKVTTCTPTDGNEAEIDRPKSFPAHQC